MSDLTIDAGCREYLFPANRFSVVRTEQGASIESSADKSVVAVMQTIPSIIPASDVLEFVCDTIVESGIVISYLVRGRHNCICPLCAARTIDATELCCFCGGTKVVFPIRLDCPSVSCSSYREFATFTREYGKVPLVGHGVNFKTVGGNAAPLRMDTIKTVLPYARKHPQTGTLCVSIKDIRALPKAMQGKLVEYGILSRHYFRLYRSTK